MEKRYISNKAADNQTNKKLLDKNPSIDYNNCMGWEYELMEWNTLYFGLFLADTFKIKKEQCIDVGGYKGLFSSVYCRHFKEVHTFEPNSYASIIAKMSFNRQELPNINLYEIALLDEEKETDFFIKFFDKTKNNISGQSNTETEIVQKDFDGEDLYTEVKKLTTKTLDSFNFKPSFLKIDVEGANLKVIQGGWETINKYKPFIQIENDADLDNNPKIEAMLVNIGYTKINPKDYSNVYDGSWELSDDYFVFA